MIGVVTGITAFVWLFPVVGNAEDFTPKKRHSHCRYESWNNRPGYTDNEVRLLIRCAVDHFPTSLSTALYVANRESGLECHAANPSSSARGIYQTLDSTWRSWWGTHGGWFNHRRWRLHSHVLGCRPNVMVSIRQAHQGGWGPWS